MTQNVHYTINFSRRNAHLFQVTLDIPEHHTNALTLSLPAWIPGSYMIRDFAKNILQLRCESDPSIHIKPTDKQTWHIHSEGKALQLRYDVYAFDTSIRSAFLDSNRAFFNGTSVFLQVEGFEQQAHQVTFDATDVPEHWRIASGLPRANNTQKLHFGDYLAQDYAQLIDCPVEIGDFDVVIFDVNDVPHHLVLTGKHYADLPRIQADLTQICAHHMRLFDDVPFDEYWFLTNILPGGFGGLEHKNSTALLCSTFDFANKNRPDDTSDNYKTFLSLCSHEYFHTWNVCRLKPRAFIEGGLADEVYTPQLWAYEGITSYYDDFSLFRCGLITFKDYLKLLSKTMTMVFRGNGDQKLAVGESSFYTWTKFYKQGEDAINNLVSYYTKGALVALWMDLSIRKHTQGQKSLDDMMRLLWQRYGKTNRGTEDHHFGEALSELCGVDIQSALNDKLYQRTRLELADELHEVGISFHLKSPKLMNTREADDSPIPRYFGANVKAHAQGLEVLSVFEDSPAERAGLQPKDIVVAIDNIYANGENFQEIIANSELNTPLALHFFRQQVLMHTECTLNETADKVVQLCLSDEQAVKAWQRIIN